LWNAADTPPADCGSGEDVRYGMRARIEAGEVFWVRTSGGGDVDVQVEGSGEALFKTQGAGHVRIASASGNVVMQDGSQPFIRGTTYADAESEFLTALETWIDALLTTIGFAGAFAADVAVNLPPVSATATAFTAGITALVSTATPLLTTAFATFRAARTHYLSGRIFGQ
jgi:hypothetical protein